MGKQENIKASERFGEAINSAQLAPFREIVAPTFVDHDPAPGQEPGPDGLIMFHETLRAAFPDLSIAVEQMIADEDNVAIAYTISGTHDGQFMGIPPTRRPVKARGMQIARFQNGQMVERWGSSDVLGIMQQIGAFPSPPG